MIFKIPNLFEKLLINNKNLREKELIRQQMKKSYKRRLMENDDDLKECAKFSKINKKEKKKYNRKLLDFKRKYFTI